MNTYISSTVISQLIILSLKLLSPTCRLYKRGPLDSVPLLVKNGVCQLGNLNTRGYLSINWEELFTHPEVLS